MSDLDGKTLYIGAIPYTIKESDDLDEDAGLYGMFDSGRQRIKIMDDLADEFETVVLLHEVGHGFHLQKGFPQPDDEDARRYIETMNDVWANGLITLFRDPCNDWLLARVTGISEQILADARELSAEEAEVEEE